MLGWLTNLFSSKPTSSTTSRAVRIVRAKYDAAATNPDNRRHWASADGLSANAANSPDVRRVLRHTVHWGVDSADMNAIDETDLLFLDSVMCASRLKLELEMHAARVRRFLVVRGTGAFGERAEGSEEPGLFHALRPYMAEHPEWFLIHHTNDEYGVTVLSRDERDRPAHPVHAWPPGFGPGTELSAILRSLGIEPGPHCDCKAKAIQMDLWGVAGCSERRDTIVGWMRDGQGRWGWRDKLAAATKAVTTGLAFSLDWTDPFPSLIDEAIRRAHQKEAIKESRS